MAVHPDDGLRFSSCLVGLTAGQVRSARLVLWTDNLSPTDVGALSVAVHPTGRRHLSLCQTHGLALLLVRQPTAVYHSSLIISLLCRW